MDIIKVKIKNLTGDAPIPVYQTPGSAACDLCAAIEEPLTLDPGKSALIPTGIAIAPEESCVCLLFARSGLAVKHGITLANSVGVIDQDYRGEIKVALINHGGEAYTVSPGERIAQMMFVRFAQAQFIQADELDDTERGEGGFGHTGK